MPAGDRLTVFVPSILDLNDIGALLAQIENVTHERLLVTGSEPRVGGRDLVLAHEEEVDVVRRQRVVERRLDRIAGPGRPHQARRDDDGEIGLVLLIALAREQRTEHRHVAEPGHLVLRGGALVLQQAAQREALAVAQLDSRGGAPHDQRRHRIAGDLHGMALVELADLGLDLEIDQSITQHGRSEGEPHAVLLVVDGDGAERLRDQDGEFAARQEARGVARQGHQVRLCETADQALFLERVDGDID